MKPFLPQLDPQLKKDDIVDIGYTFKTIGRYCWWSHDKFEDKYSLSGFANVKVNVDLIKALVQ